MVNDFTVHKESYNPSDAEYVLLNRNYPGQRSIRSRHVNALVNEINNGRMRVGTAIAFCELPNGVKYLVNGQHTLSAIVKSMSPMTLTVENYKCDDMHDVASVFATYDRQMSRGPSDIYHAYNFANEIGFTPTATGVFVTAVGFLYVELAKVITDRKPAPQEMMELSRPMAWRFSRYSEATDSTRKSKYKSRGTVVALALITANHPKHHDFWNGYASDDGLRYYDPRKQFLEFIKEHATSGGRNNEHRTKINAITSFKVGAYCWNKYVTGAAIKSLQIDKCRDTNSVAGTMYSSGFGPDSFEKLLMEQPR